MAYRKPHVFLNVLKVSILGIFIIFIAGLLFWIKKPHSPAISDKANTIVETCKNQKNWNDCYANEVNAFLEYEEISSFIPLLTLLEKKDPKVADCHYLTHNIAQNFTEKHLHDPFSLFQSIPPDTCGGGLIHGIIEAKKTFDKNFTFSPRNSDTICKNLHKYETSKYTHEFCSHVIGHIVLVEQDGNVDNAVEFCMQTEKNEQYHCLTGVFMESITRENLVSHGIRKPLPWIPFTINRQKDVCNTYTGKIQDACWEETSHMFNVYENANPTTVYEQCNTAPTQSAQKSCLMHASILLMLSPNIKTTDIPLLCKPLYNTNKDYHACIEIVTDAAVIVSEKNQPKVDILCNSLEEAAQNICRK